MKDLWLSFHKFMGTPLAVVLLGVFAVWATCTEIGQWGGLFMALLVLMVAVLDVIWGKLKEPFSLAVNEVYCRNRRRYLRRVFYMALVIVGLYIPFTSPTLIK